MKAVAGPNRAVLAVLLLWIGCSVTAPIGPAQGDPDEEVLDETSMIEHFSRGTFKEVQVPTYQVARELPGLALDGGTTEVTAHLVTRNGRQQWQAFWQQDIGIGKINVEIT